MKKMIALFFALAIALSSVVPVSAADGEVTYVGKAKQFIFEPGSEYSVTDLFPNFKGVMPGDTLTQKITVKNDVSKHVKVKVYMRALGAHKDSEEFLSQLRLQVEKSEDNESAYMFDAAVSESAQLTDWVCLGTLYSGGEIDLDVTLHVPVELDNEFKNKIGYLDWEFMIKEYPVEDSDPKPPVTDSGLKKPQTGDQAEIGLWMAVMCCSLGGICILLKRRKEDTKNNEDVIKR